MCLLGELPAEGAIGLSQARRIHDVRCFAGQSLARYGHAMLMPVARMEKRKMTIPPPKCPYRMHRYATPLLAAVVALFHAFLATAAAAQAIIVYGDERLPPYEFMEDGIAKGVNIDLWHAIGDRLGRPVEIRLTDWAKAQASVLEGRGDTLSLMAPTPEREANFSFSQTTFSFSFSLFVRTDEVARFNGIPLAMRRIGVTAGGFPRPYFEKRHPDVQLIPIADNIDGIRRVLRGDIDAFAAATWSGNYLIRELGISGITPLPQPFAVRNAGIAVPHANATLLADIDRALGQIKADGTFDRIIDQWTGDHVVIFSQKDIRFFGMAVGTITLTIMLAGVVIIARNKQRKLAREVDAAQEAVRALVNASSQPMAILSTTATREFVIDWGNERFAKLALCSLDDILGAPLGTLWPEALTSATWSAMNLKDRTSLEIMTERSDGPLDLELLFTPISPLGTVMVTARDRSQERQIARKEAERHRLEALGRMAGRIAHEINNVLQPVLTYASLAWSESQGNPKAQAYLDEAQDGIREGREIVRSVLALAGGHAVTRHPRQLEDEVAKALNLLVATVPSEITVESSLPPTHGLVALAPSELLQVLGNLIVNAADAITGSGQIRVSTASVNLDGNSAATFGVSPGRYAELTVSDTGKGMDEAILVRALDPFFTTKDVDRGAGLGLSTVLTILDSMGAGIGLFSSPGAGTTVRVVFPLLTPSC